MFDFDWDDANRAHLAAHDVTVDEAEQVMENDPLDLEHQADEDEERILQVGLTNAGRYLMVVTTWREDRPRVVTAFPASPGFRQLYLRERGRGHGKHRDKDPEVRE